MTAALDEAARYSFIRPVSIYGEAVLPLLDELTWEGDKKWCKRLFAGVRAQAAYYPLLLQPPLAPAEALTAAEMQILRLCARIRATPRSAASWISSCPR